jgi:hypothetical protein
VISFAVTFAAWRAERSPKGEAWWARQVAHKSTSSTACKKVVTKKPLMKPLGFLTRGHAHPEVARRRQRPPDLPFASSHAATGAFDASPGVG